MQDIYLYDHLVSVVEPQIMRNVLILRNGIIQRIKVDLASRYNAFYNFPSQSIIVTISRHKIKTDLSFIL